MLFLGINLVNLKQTHPKNVVFIHQKLCFFTFSFIFLHFLITQTFHTTKRKAMYGDVREETPCVLVSLRVS